MSCTCDQDHQSATPSNASDASQDPQSSQLNPFNEAASVGVDDTAARAKRRSENYRLILAFAVFVGAMSIIATAVYVNPGVYKLDEQTVAFLSQAFNAGVLLTIPFLLGAVGAGTRLLLSEVRIVDKLPLVGGSAFMACFSWISIKSGVLVSLVAPHLAPRGIDMKDALSTPNSFYTMSLVAILVGMFSTNLYLFITQRVEQLSKQPPNGK
ncbi:hypothetical protein K5D57_01355 [Pseudomonas cichorii]|uniref:hypothetical protein n=1 Tax=Pseudomonas TaxID=286 RepID=UPI000CF362E9|nr:MULTISPECIES: hypothetical protein [Pseudomonas]MBX8521386.1 hypothetical protein [Pseudomonas cichorii]MBX8558359.1 hypothetical protein [Pseudomonas cichorii]GFM67549.1 hypothetical protein PSCICJ_36670 [Pseudomonas cichorii]